jgi:hypothetical protein
MTGSVLDPFQRAKAVRYLLLQWPVDEIARAVHCHPRTIYNMIWNGDVIDDNGGDGNWMRGACLTRQTLVGGGAKRIRVPRNAMIFAQNKIMRGGSSIFNPVQLFDLPHTVKHPPPRFPSVIILLKTQAE